MFFVFNKNSVTTVSVGVFEELSVALGLYSTHEGQQAELSHNWAAWHTNKIGIKTSQQKLQDFCFESRGLLVFSYLS